MFKSLLVGIVLVLVSCSLFAGEHSMGTSSQVQGQEQDQSSNSNSSTTYNHNVPRTVPSALAPSVVNGTDCAITQADSKAFSIFILSVSGTVGTTFNDLCYAYKRGQFDVADTLACLKSQQYADSNPSCPALIDKYETNKMTRLEKQKE